jgi:hypothetical protein
MTTALPLAASSYFGLTTEKKIRRNVTCSLTASWYCFSGPSNWE